MDVYPHAELTDKIIGCFFEVYNTLGFGFLEKVYERAMLIELRDSGLEAINQQTVSIHYKGTRIGVYTTDIVVERTVMLELKAVSSLLKEHEYQLVNVLRASDIELGLLFNFGKFPELRRKIFSNSRKKL